MQMAMDDYQLLTSTRYDTALLEFSWNNDCDGPSPYFLLPYHYDRLQNAAKVHGWTPLKVYTYKELKAAIANVVIVHLHGSSQSEWKLPSALRVRILLARSGELQVTVAALEEGFSGDPFSLSVSKDVQAVDLKSLPMISLHVDKEPTEPTLFTETKTTARQVYEEARIRNDLAPLTTPSGKAKDVVLYNTEGLVMETSIFNIAFLRGSHWMTPSTASGCLAGVARRWLLENGRMVEDVKGTLEVASVTHGEIVLLFNGVQGCRLGIINGTNGRLHR
ncbi:aminodeoxychorismate lyase [Ephemerocybe angulata]|uniref:Aminodeoxychorismate lyase n=1 Tax=Ephemerocybe angulata TaxID=980116 RepID=A0A8H6IJN3_9AGAR|nr:aminodeoxychorismate lyase [Tulosesus angulatus]